VAVLLHGTYNSLFLLGVIYPILALNVGALLILVSIIAKAEAESPYRTFPVHDWAHAVTVIGRGIRHDDANKDFYLRRGYYLLCGGLYGKASTDFRKAVLLSKDKSYANACLAAALALENDTVAARDLLGDRFESLSQSRRRSFRDSLARGLRGERRRTILGLLDGIYAPLCNA